MTLLEIVSIIQVIAITFVGVCEIFLIVELRKTRVFIQKMQDNVLGAVGANMAINTFIAAVTAFLQRRGKDASGSD